MNSHREEKVETSRTLDAIKLLEGALNKMDDIMTSSSNNLCLFKVYTYLYTFFYNHSCTVMHLSTYSCFIFKILKFQYKTLLCTLIQQNVHKFVTISHEVLSVNTINHYRYIIFKPYVYLKKITE